MKRGKIDTLPISIKKVMASRSSILCVVILSTVLAGVFGYAEKAEAIYGGSYSRVYQVGMVTLKSITFDFVPCTGVLIAPNAVLTSITCTKNFSASQLKYVTFTFGDGDNIESPILEKYESTPRADYRYRWALLRLQNPLYSLAPFPMLEEDPPTGQRVLLVGNGESCFYCRNYEQASLGYAFNFESRIPMPLCDGDIGAPILTLDGRVAGIVTGIYNSVPSDSSCGRGYGSFTVAAGGMISGDEIRLVLGAWGGPAACRINSIEANPQNAQETIMKVVVTGATPISCKYIISDLITTAPFSCTSNLFQTISLNLGILTPGNHWAKVTAYNIKGQNHCVDGLTIFAPPDYPKVALNLNNSNVPINGQVIANSAVTTCISPPCVISWTYQTTAKAPSKTNLFAMPYDALNNLASFFAGFLKSFPMWKQ